MILSSRRINARLLLTHQRTLLARVHLMEEVFTFFEPQKSQMATVPILIALALTAACHDTAVIQTRTMPNAKTRTTHTTEYVKRPVCLHTLPHRNRWRLIEIWTPDEHSHALALN